MGLFNGRQGRAGGAAGAEAALPSKTDAETSGLQRAALLRELAETLIPLIDAYSSGQAGAQIHSSLAKEVGLVFEALRAEVDCLDPRRTFTRAQDDAVHAGSAAAAAQAALNPGLNVWWRGSPVKTSYAEWSLLHLWYHLDRLFALGRSEEIKSRVRKCSRRDLAEPDY